MATKLDDTSVAEIESFLTCFICLETLNKPRTLPCFHSFCTSCLDKFLKKEREKTVGRKKEEYSCPTCRSIFPLKSSEDVTVINTSHFIQNMSDMVSVQREPNSAKCSTSQCEKTGIARCMTCELFMCDACSKFHENWPAFKKHSVLPISKLTEGLRAGQDMLKARSNCKKHVNKTLKFYCKTCKELVCRYCMDFNHTKQNHSCLLAEDVADQKRQALKTSCRILEKKLEKGSQALRDTTNATHCLKGSLDKAKAKVKRHKDDVLEVFELLLDKKFADMIGQLELEYNKQHEPFDKNVTALTSYLERIKLANKLSKSVLEHGNDEDIIAVQDKIQDNLESLERGYEQSMQQSVERVYIGYTRNPELDEMSLTKLFCDTRLGNVVTVPLVPASTLQDSEILKGEQKFIWKMKEWLNDQNEWSLCYRASKDGWNSTCFHSCCDGRGPTVTLVKVKTYIFGGFTDQDWQESGAKRSRSSFLFSLRNKDNLPPFKAPVSHSEKVAVYSSPGCGPAFGSGFDLYICDNPHCNLYSYTQFGQTYKLPLGYSFGYQRTNSLLAGSFKFQPCEIEVFYQHAM